MKFKVEITETHQRIVETEAACWQDAVVKVKNQYFLEEIVLAEKDHVGAEFSIVNEDVAEFRNTLI